MNAGEALAALRAAFDEPRPTATFADMRQELESGEAALWIGDRSTVFLRVEDCTTHERVMHTGPAAGDMSEIMTRGVAEVEAMARRAGCTQVHVRAGREGWRRPLEQHGYEVTAIVMRKILSDG